MTSSGESTGFDIDALFSSLEPAPEPTLQTEINGDSHRNGHQLIDPNELIRSVLNGSITIEPVEVAPLEREIDLEVDLPPTNGHNGHHIAEPETKPFFSDVEVAIPQPEANGAKGTDLWTRPSTKQTRQPRRPRGSISDTEREEHIGDDLIKIYLREIGKYPLLTKDDEVRLSKQIAIGIAAQERLEAEENLSPADKRQVRRDLRAGEEARLRFINSNLRLVVSIAKRYRYSELPLLDLIQEGNLGLQHAVDKFDWQKGFKFSTYATWWIRQAITRGIANTGSIVRLPVHMHDEANRLARGRNVLAIQLGRDPTRAELAEHLELDEKDVLKILHASRNSSPISLDERMSDDENSSTLGDLTPDAASSDGYEKVEMDLLSADIEEVLDALDEREKRIVKLRFGLITGQRMTLEEVGEEFNLTRERVRQIEKRALAKLQHPSASSRLRHYLGS